MPFSPRGIEQTLVLPPRWPLIPYTGTLYMSMKHRVTNWKDRARTIYRSKKSWWSLSSLVTVRAVASLTIPGGQEFHFPHFFPEISINFSDFSSNFTYFLPYFGPPHGRIAHPGRPWLRHWSLGLFKCIVSDLFFYNNQKSATSVFVILPLQF